MVLCGALAWEKMESISFHGNVKVSAKPSKNCLDGTVASDALPHLPRRM